MKFSCSQKELTKALNIVSKGVTLRTTIPILKGILLKVEEDGTLSMSASDLDITIEKKIKVTNFQEGETVVQAKLFGDIIRKLPNEEVFMETKENSVFIQCLQSEFHLVASPADEFPRIGVLEEDNDKLLLDKELFKEMIKKTSFAASIDDSRGIITGVLFETEKNSLNMVSLDGFRMAITRESMKNEKEKRIVIPAKIIFEIGKILSEDDGDLDDVEIYISNNRATFIYESVKIVVRLLEGEFVKYEDILPKENKIRVVVNKNELLNSIERASLFAKIGKNNLVKLNIKDNIIEITSKSEEGDVNESVNISKEGDNIIIGFNSKYLIDALKVINDQEVLLLLNNSVSPCLIKPLTGNTYEYLILPVRITNN